MLGHLSGADQLCRIPSVAEEALQDDSHGQGNLSLQISLLPPQAESSLHLCLRSVLHNSSLR